MAAFAGDSTSRREIEISQDERGKQKQKSAPKCALVHLLPCVGDKPTKMEVQNLVEVVGFEPTSQKTSLSVLHV